MTPRNRRFLPSVSLLLAIESVLRLGSTVAAARELNLSQSTVSRLVKALEDQLGQVLFLREAKRLIPTSAARAYGKEVSRCLDLLQRASLDLVATPRGGTLTLGLLPAFGSRWLAPRLGGFTDSNPGVTLHLVTRTPDLAFEAHGTDASVLFGTGQWPRARAMPLFRETLTACAAPALLARHPGLADGRLPSGMMLQLESRPEAWAAWFQGQSLMRVPPAGMIFDQFAPMIQAAISGLGVALLPDYLAQSEVTEGRLTAILTPGVSGDGGYWLVWPEDRKDSAPFDAFRKWIAAELSPARAKP